MPPMSPYGRVWGCLPSLGSLWRGTPDPPSETPPFRLGPAPGRMLQEDCIPALPWRQPTASLPVSLFRVRRLLGNGVGVLSVGRMELDGRGPSRALGPMEEAEPGPRGQPTGQGPQAQPPSQEEEEQQEQEQEERGLPGCFPVELPPCHRPHGAPLGELVASQAPPQPPSERAPQESPRPMPPRGKCLLDNWQEERATNPLDQVPCPEMGTESYVFRGGHRGLLTLQAQAGLASATTTKEAFQTPRRTGLPVRGKREAMMEWLLYQKHSKEVFAEQVQAAPRPMESQSTTHRDFFQEGFVSMPPAPTKPHNYRLEQPQTFWRENAQRVTGVSCIRTEDTPFKKCAAFTTPAADYLEQPHDQETYPNF